MSLRILALLLLVASPALAQEKRTADPKTDVGILVNDAVPASVEVGAYYARKHGIPAEQVCHVRTGTDEVIAWPALRKEVLEPLRAFLATRPKVLYVVPTWGIPVKTAEENPANDAPAKDTLAQFVTGRDYACVDRELELLHQEHELDGWLPSKLHGQRRHVTLQDRVLIVSRLDGPSPEAARALVDNALYGEAYGIEGKALIDVRGLDKGTDGYAECDRRMRALAPVLEKAGVDHELDERPDVVDLATRSSLGHYWGWYTGNVICSRDDWRFVRGAVGAHLHSFAAATLRSRTRTWTGPLVGRGITGTFGTVHEPLIAGFPDGTTFFERFLEGYSFGEALVLANQMTSWHAVFVGDPLYAPYAADVRSAQAANRAFAKDAHGALSAALDGGDAPKLAELLTGLDALGALHEGAKDCAFLAREARSRLALPQKRARGKIEELRKALDDARAALREGDPKGAVAAARKALDLSPGSADANLTAGMAHLLAGSAKPALAALELAAKVDRPFAAAWLGRAQGRAALDEKKWPDAVQLLEAARTAFPGDRLLAADAARAHLGAKDAKTAAALLAEALREPAATFADVRGLAACYEVLAACTEDRRRAKDLGDVAADLKRLRPTPRDKAAQVEEALAAGAANAEKLGELPALGKSRGLPRLRLENGTGAELEVLLAGPLALRATTKPGKRADLELAPGTYRVLVRVLDGAKPRAFAREQRLDVDSVVAIALDEKLALTKPAD